MTQGNDNEPSNPLEGIVAPNNSGTDDEDSDDEEELSEFQKRVKENIEDNVSDIALRSSSIIDDNSPPPEKSECDRCGSHRENFVLECGNYQRYVCKDCRNVIIEEIDNHYWFDRFTENHFKAVKSYLEELDEVWCVHGHSSSGELFVHTGYCSELVVDDITNLAGHVRAFGIEREDADHAWDCMDEHGDCIEINIDFSGDSVPIMIPPVSTFAKMLYSTEHKSTDLLDEEDKLFEKE